MKKTERGRLFIVSTPIGNMGDMSGRAVDCLKSVEIVACEDTRRTGRLLSRLGFKKRLVSYHDHNEAARSLSVVRALEDGLDVAVVSDAGTPGVSDPAYRVVRAAIDSGCEVIPVPGPSSLLSALVVSGLPLDRFVFEGFLPRKGAKRTKRLEFLSNEPRTIVLFESPHRIIRLLEEIIEILGDREVSVSRELTKLHEETVRGRASEVLETLKTRPPRGEYTVVVEGSSNKDSSG